jgi:hypothetical protein
VAIPLTSPLYVWDDMASYLNYVTNNEQTFQNPARFAMLLFGPLFVVLLRSIHDLAPHEKRPLTRIALCFGWRSRPSPASTTSSSSPQFG